MSGTGKPIGKGGVVIWHKRTSPISVHGNSRGCTLNIPQWGMYDSIQFLTGQIPASPPPRGAVTTGYLSLLAHMTEGRAFQVGGGGGGALTGTDKVKQEGSLALLAAFEKHASPEMQTCQKSGSRQTAGNAS